MCHRWAPSGTTFHNQITSSMLSFDALSDTIKLLKDMSHVGCHELLSSDHPYYHISIIQRTTKIIMTFKYFSEILKL